MSDQDTPATESEAVEETTEDAPAVESEEQPQEGAPELEEVDEDVAWDPKVAKRKIQKLNNEIRSTKERLQKAPKAEDVAAKEQRIGELEPENLRLRVGYELGLPLDLALRLNGKTKEEMVADAQTLVELIAPTKRPTQRPTETLRGGLQPEQEPEETDLSKLGARMFRR